MERETLELLSI